MKKKQTVINKNYLEQTPLRHPQIEWTKDDKGIVTLEIENTGLFNKIAQKVFKRPKISYIHLDEMGSFIWPILDESKTIVDLGVEVKEHFGEDAEPLYERLAQFFKVLESYHFIIFKQ